MSKSYLPRTIDTQLIRMPSAPPSRKVVQGFPQRYQIPAPANKFSGLIIMFSIEDQKISQTQELIE